MSRNNKRTASTANLEEREDDAKRAKTTRDLLDAVAENLEQDRREWQMRRYRHLKQMVKILAEGGAIMDSYVIKYPRISGTREAIRLPGEAPPHAKQKDKVGVITGIQSDPVTENDIRRLGIVGRISDVTPVLAKYFENEDESVIDFTNGVFL